MTEARVGRKNVGTLLRGEGRRLPAESATAMATAHESGLSLAPVAERWGTVGSIDLTAGQDPCASAGPRDCVSLLRHREAAERRSGLVGGGKDGASLGAFRPLP